MVIRQRFSFGEVRDVLGMALSSDMHAKRIDSLANATLGVLHSASLAVCTIGQGLAVARGLSCKHAVKQVDRLLSNPAIRVNDILTRWVPYVIGARTAIVVALDWTEFDADKQATIMLSLVTDHGRATPWSGSRFARTPSRTTEISTRTASGCGWPSFYRLI